MRSCASIRLSTSAKNVAICFATYGFSPRAANAKASLRCSCAALNESSTCVVNISGLLAYGFLNSEHQMINQDISSLVF